MKLKPTLLFALAAALLLSATGCTMFRKSKKPKPNPAIASELESDFRQRWVQQRAAELATGGGDAIAARAQAEREFADKFPHLLPRGK